MPMQFWSSERRGAVAIATYSNPPYNYLGQPVIDELGQLVTDWQDPAIRAVVIQSEPQG
jgi:enoyl-CoA hydratase/carnithine racemase